MHHEARVAQIKALEAEMLASPDRKLVIEYKLVAKTYGVFKGNARELLEYLDQYKDPAVALPLWDLKHRERLYDFLDEVGRLLRCSLVIPLRAIFRSVGLRRAPRP